MIDFFKILLLIIFILGYYDLIVIIFNGKLPSKLNWINIINQKIRNRF